MVQTKQFLSSSTETSGRICINKLDFQTTSSHENRPFLKIFAVYTKAEDTPLVFYQKAAGDGKSLVAEKSKIHVTKWPTSENGGTIAKDGDIPGPEEHPKGASGQYQEFVYRIGRTRAAYKTGDNLGTNRKEFVEAAGYPKKPDEEMHLSPLGGMGRSFAAEKDINLKLWTSMPHGNDVHGEVEARDAANPDPRLRYMHIVRSTDKHKEIREHNVSQGLLRVIQRSMAAGVMIELYRQMAEISLYTFINNSLPRIRQHLYESLENIHTLEQATQIAERYETSRKGGEITKFSLHALERHLGLIGEGEDEAAVADEAMSQMQEDLEYQHQDNGYDGQLNAVNRNRFRGISRNGRSMFPGGSARIRGRGGSNERHVSFVRSANLAPPGQSTGYQAKYNKTNEGTPRCWRCQSADHLIGQCPETPVLHNKGPNFPRKRGTKLRTYMRRPKFNALNVCIGSEDIEGYYDEETGEFEPHNDLPDSVSHDSEAIEEMGTQFNSMNVNSENSEYLGSRYEEIDVDAYLNTRGEI